MTEKGQNVENPILKAINLYLRILEIFNMAALHQTRSHETLRALTNRKRGIFEI